MSTQNLSFSAVKLRTSPVLIRALRNGVVLFAMAFIAALASVDTSTSLLRVLPYMGPLLFTLPAAVIACCCLAWFVLYDYESPLFLDIGIMHLAAMAGMLLGLTFCFTWLSHSTIGSAMAPGWGHADRLMNLDYAVEQIKAGGGTLAAPENKMIARSLETLVYQDVRLAHRQYEQKEMSGEPFSRWIMAHHLYPIYDKDRIAQLQAVGWADQRTVEEAKSTALTRSPPAGSTLIQQQAWAVLAGEANPMDKMGKVLEGKE